MLVFSLDLAMAVYHASGTSTRFPALIGLDLPASFLYGPLLYLYARTLTTPRPALRRRALLHFTPFLLAALFFAPLFARSGAGKLALLANPDLALQTQALVVVNPLKLIHGTVYLVLLVGLLRRHRARVEATSSSAEHVVALQLKNALAAKDTRLDYNLRLGAVEAVREGYPLPVLSYKVEF